MVRGRWRVWVRRFSLEEEGALRKTGKEKKTGEGRSEERGKESRRFLSHLGRK
jgi:hypothetical protein